MAKSELHFFAAPRVPIDVSVNNEQACITAAERMNEENNRRMPNVRMENERRASSYLSELPRRIVPCEAENIALFKMMASVSAAQRTRIEKDEEDNSGRAKGGLKVHR